MTQGDLYLVDKPYKKKSGETVFTSHQNNRDLSKYRSLQFNMYIFLTLLYNYTITFLKYQHL